MFTKNVFTQKDPIAELVKPMLEAQVATKTEELKGNQKVLDKNKNNKLDADDFKILRGEKKAMKEEEEVEESTNPFSKDYKSQIPSKPGEKAGFDSKKISTGTVYSRKHKADDKDDENVKKEEVEQVDEASYSAKAARAGKDIGKPGKMFKKIAKRAAARYGSTEKGKKVAGAVLAKLRKEETDFEPLLIDRIVEDTMSAIEQLDELSKSTLGSYVKHAARDVGASRKLAADFKNQADKARKPSAKAASSSLSKKFLATAQKRHTGIGKAVERLTKEEVEQIEERSLTSGETAEKERIVKGMKKNMAGFKSRYGERAKSVMYATATKAAKKD